MENNDFDSILENRLSGYTDDEVKKAFQILRIIVEVVLECEDLSDEQRSALTLGLMGLMKIDQGF